MTEVTLNAKAKELLKANESTFVNALLAVVRKDDLIASATQTLALTAYKTFEANGEAVKAEVITGYFGIDETGLAKLKQYVSRAKKLYENKGASFVNGDKQEVTIDHEAIMGDNPPNLTTMYNHYLNHLKVIKTLKDVQDQEHALQAKAATKYFESGEAMPEGVASASELLSKARSAKDLDMLDHAAYEALQKGHAMLAAETEQALADEQCVTLLKAAQDALDGLLALGTEQSGDAIATLATYLDNAQNEAIEAMLNVA